MEGFRIFWAWLCLTDALKLLESKYQAGLEVNIWGKNMVPIYTAYSTTVFYDTSKSRSYKIFCIFSISLGTTILKSTVTSCWDEIQTECMHSHAYFSPTTVHPAKESVNCVSCQQFISELFIVAVYIHQPENSLFFTLYVCMHLYIYTYIYIHT